MGFSVLFRSVLPPLDMAAAHLPDAVLLNNGLPEINGYEIARRLRLLPQLRIADSITSRSSAQAA